MSSDTVAHIRWKSRTIRTANVPDDENLNRRDPKRTRCVLRSNYISVGGILAIWPIGESFKSSLTVTPQFLENLCLAGQLSARIHCLSQPGRLQQMFLLKWFVLRPVFYLELRGHYPGHCDIAFSTLKNCNSKLA